MNMPAIKRWCASLLLSGFACGSVLAQQTYGSGITSGSDVPPATSSGGGGTGAAESGASGTTTPGGTSDAPATGQADPTPGTGGMESGVSGVGSGAAGTQESGSGSQASLELLPDTAGASAPSDADPYKSLMPKEKGSGMMSR